MFKFIGKFNIDLEALAYLKKIAPHKVVKSRGVSTKAAPVIISTPENLRKELAQVFQDPRDYERLVEFQGNLPYISPKIIAKLKNIFSFGVDDPMDSPISSSFSSLSTGEGKTEYDKRQPFTRAMRYIYEDKIPELSNGKLVIIPTSTTVPDPMNVYYNLSEIHEDFNDDGIDPLDPNEMMLYYEVQPVIDTKRTHYRNNQEEPISVYDRKRGVIRRLKRQFDKNEDIIEEGIIDTNPKNYLVDDESGYILNFDPIVANFDILRRLVDAKRVE